MSESPVRLRLDKWLWAARFFKTRSLASAAISGGHVKVNGGPAKPAKEIVIDDQLEIRAHEQLRHVRVLALNEQRRPAPEARLLYEETPESAARRAEIAEMRRLAPSPGANSKGRPSKRDARQLKRLY